MDVSSLVLGNGGSLSDEHLEQWYELIKNNRAEGKILITTLDPLKRSSLASALCLSDLLWKHLKCAEYRGPNSSREAHLLDERAAKDYIKGPAASWAKRAMCPHLKLDNDDLLNIAGMLKRDILREPSGKLMTLRFRSWRYELYPGGLPTGTNELLPLLGKHRLGDLVRKTKRAALITAIFNTCPPDDWEACSWGGALAAIYDSPDAVLHLVQQNPELGQLALQNPKFTDKSEVFERWVRGYKFYKPRWGSRGGSDPAVLAPKPVVCDLSKTKVGFFTAPRIKALAAAAVFGSLTVVVNPRAREKLLKHEFPVDLLDVCEYEEQISHPVSEGD